MTTRRLTIIEMVVCVIAAVILFVTLLTFNVQAQELASGADNAAISSLSPQKNGAGVNAFSGNSTNTKADILKQRGVPGKGIDQAPGLQKQFNSNAASDNRTKSFLYRWQQRFQEMIQKFSKGTKP